jgi:hypothetical protein
MDRRGELALDPEPAENAAAASQEESAVSLGSLREELHVFARKAGTMVGNITIVDTGDEIDCRRMGSAGYAMPSPIERSSLQWSVRPLRRLRRGCELHACLCRPPSGWVTKSTPMDPPDTTQEVTHLLGRLRAGDDEAAGQLLPLVYDELHGLAQAVFSGQRGNHTLQPTALVHEAWMKLAGNLDNLEDRRHFFVVAAKAMRQVLAAGHARCGPGAGGGFGC